MFEIVTNQKPFENINLSFHIFKNVIEGNHPEFKQSIPDSYRSLIERCWLQSPEDRLTFDQIPVSF